MNRQLLQQLPKMDVLLAHPAICVRLGGAALLCTERGGQNRPGGAAPLGSWMERWRSCPTWTPWLPRLRPGPGVPAVPTCAPSSTVPAWCCIQTWARAPLGEAGPAVYEAARGIPTLEYDIDSGARGSRFSHIEPLICSLTGSEAALAVNNNAAAVFLMLSALAAGKKWRSPGGELVRSAVPSGCRRSWPAAGTAGGGGYHQQDPSPDYRRAIEEQGLRSSLKVHTSNFQTHWLYRGGLHCRSGRPGRGEGRACLPRSRQRRLYDDPAWGVPGGPHGGGECARRC